MRTFLVISDIHSSTKPPYSDDAVSYVSTITPENHSNDPFSSILSVLPKDEKIDAVICPGDITDKADPSALKHAWNSLSKLAETLDAKLIATVGNHDLDSRNINDADPVGQAMSLSPSIPVPDRERYLEYWAENFTVFTCDDVRVLILNTAAHHGRGREPELLLNGNTISNETLARLRAQLAELEHGRISDHTLDRIKKRISCPIEFKVNILLCHHHLMQNSEINETDYSEAKGGNKLIQLLEHSGVPWIVVHGHKHRPQVANAQGGGNAPILIGAASFSANVRRDAQNHSPNQMHLIKVVPEAADQLGLNCAGIVTSWNWLPSLKWQKASGATGLPARAGFGAKPSIIGWARKLADAAKVSNGTPLHEPQILDVIPELPYALPGDVALLKARLETEHGAVVIVNDGSIIQIGLSS